MAALFRIITDGKLREGVDAEQFVSRFVSTFKVSEDQARKLLSTQRAVTLKDKLGKDTADKYQRVLQEQTGLIVRVEEIPEQSSLAQASLSYEGQETGESTDEPPPASEGRDRVRCPKCGSDRVSGDDCLACGIIISRYRARQAESDQAQQTESRWNPYQTTHTEDVEDEVDFVIRRVDAGDGWQWVVGGWSHFKANPFAWIGTLIIWYVLMIVASLVPFIGSVAINILSPVFIAGIMLGAREQASGGNFTVGYLFQGFSTEFAKLAQAGLLYMVGTVLIVFVGGIIFAVAGFGLFSQHAGAAAINPTASIIGIFFLILVVLVAMALLAMAFYYVPLLIVFDGLGPVEAINKSFSACWKNAIPFLVYGLIILGLGIVATIPFGLGLFVFAPVVIASVYVSYRSIFYGEAY